jgi:ATP-binding cassette subfamily C protein
MACDDLYQGNVAMARDIGDGKASELRGALARYKSSFVAVALVSAVINVLLLGGSIYMMAVYDSVLPSRSIPTLVGLFTMITLVYLFQGAFEGLRSRMLADIAAAFDARVSSRVLQATMEFKSRGVPLPGDGLATIRDFDNVRTFLAGNGPAAFIDLPWIIFFVGVLFMLHYWLGVVTLVGAVVMFGLTLLTDAQTKDAIREQGRNQAMRNGVAEASLRHLDVLNALGMRGRMLGRWADANAAYRDGQDRVTDRVALYGGISKVFRMFLQSLILTVGALLVIDGRASGGIIFASSILSGRALAPVDSVIANWRALSSARLGWNRLGELLSRAPEASPMIELPRPQHKLTVEELRIAPPGSDRATVAGVDFELAAGTVLGVIGPSAAGKTSLARGLVGAWPPQRGSVRLDNATLAQWPVDVRGRHLGYLPQSAELMTGTVAQNIARFAEDAVGEAVVAAAKAAGAHDMIVALPHGYQTQIGEDGAQLSAGQRQRIGLARALFGDPFLVVLDEPNSNLDGEGEDALAAAILGIKARKGIAVVIAHRPGILTVVDKLLMMRDGRAEAFGDRDEVLARVSKPTVPQAPPVPAPAQPHRVLVREK